MLLAAVRVGPWPVGALRDVLRAAGLTEWSVKRAVSTATHDGDLVLIRQNFWAAASFLQTKGDSWLYADGHSREELISRLSARSRPPDISPSTTEFLMQGEDADRLAREDFGRNG